MKNLLNKQIIKILQEDEENSHKDPQDSITGFGNYNTARLIPPPESKKIVNNIINELKNIKNDQDIRDISIKYKDVTYGESQAVLHTIVINSNLLYNTVASIKHAPENAVPSKTVTDKILSDLGPTAISNWIEFKDLFIQYPQNSMQLTCLLIAGLVILYDR